ncbi:alpha/beta-hydrolase [Rickenella mellea]|uniref:Alpha/beta-hydrolase n=1 Tax=Rickenella mellea TaxID=50990 RepID=A0A4Y7PY78_9AGAM|nr:alpha/beta-hydrolase [Rickenella mellea]
MSNYLPSLESIAKGAFASAIGFSSISLGLLYYGQNYLIYPSAFPPGSRTDVPVPTDYGVPYEDLSLDTSDGVKIRTFLLMQRRNIPQAADIPNTDDMSDADFAARRPTVLMFHGNGGNAGHRIPLAKVFYLKLRCNVLMLSYRGYGLSEGSPSEKGIRIDAQTVLDYVTSHPILSRTPIVLYGQSIGGAVAIDLASRNTTTIRALILENTFLSIPRLIPTALPLLSPLSFLCHQKWDSASKVPLLPRDMPVLTLSGRRDEVVPQAHMIELEKILRGGAGEGGGGGKLRPGKFVEFYGGAHNDTCVQPGYWNAVAEFIGSL